MCIQCKIKALETIVGFLDALTTHKFDVIQHTYFVAKKYCILKKDFIEVSDKLLACATDKRIGDDLRKSIKKEFRRELGRVMEFISKMNDSIKKAGVVKVANAIVDIGIDDIPSFVNLSKGFGMEQAVRLLEDTVKISLEAAKDICSVCKKVGQTMSCSKCREVRYCGRECQVKDWNKHKSNCKHSPADISLNISANAPHLAHPPSSRSDAPHLHIYDDCGVAVADHEEVILDNEESKMEEVD